MRTPRIAAFLAGAALAFCAAVSVAQPRGEGALVSNPHQDLVKQYEGTKTCLECHESQAKDAFGSIHYQWRAPAPNLVNAAGRPLGKIDSTNDFCTNPSFQWIGILTNDAGKLLGNGCSKCHAGLGAKPSETLSRAQLENIDCMVCHSTGYKREVAKRADGSLGWLPVGREDPALMASLGQNVGKPTNLNCLACHAGSGGGPNFKRGDIEPAHMNATRDFDVHVGSGMQCIQCHRFKDHRIEGGGTQMSGMDRPESDRPKCESCHAAAPHKDAAVNRHAATVYCTTCHIPSFAKKQATDMRRDWSRAEEVPGQGRFEPAIELAKDVKPVYAWWNGKGTVALLGEPVKAGANGKVAMYRPEGAKGAAGSKIYAFKYHTARIPVEAATGLMVPVQVGPTFKTGNTMASALGGAKGYLGRELKASDIAYVETERFMGLFHEVVPKSGALGCVDCHAPNGRLDWKALGYKGDPAPLRGRS